MSRFWQIAVPVVVLVVGLGAWLGYRDARAAQSALADARRSLEQGRQALVDDRIDAAGSAFDAARIAVAAAERRLDGPVWWLADKVPGVRPNVLLAREATDLAAAAVDLGQAATGEAADLLDGSALNGLVTDGRVDLARLDDLRRVLDALPVGPVEVAAARIEAIPEGAVLGRLRRDRADAIALAGEVTDQIGQARTTLDVLGHLLGEDGPRTLSVLVQNNGELRGTGGLVNYVAQMTVDDGAIRLRGGTAIEEAGLFSVATSPLLDQPVARPAAFANRYDPVAAGAFLSSVNVDPDLPMTGPVAERLLEGYGQPAADGLLVIDPVALGAIVEVTGQSLRLPPEAVDAGLPATVSGADLPQVLLVDVYDAIGGGGTARGAFDEAVTLQAFDRLTAGGWDAVAMAKTIGQLLGQRHIQLWSSDAEQQARYEQLGIGGAMPTTTDGGGTDVLAVTANNAAANKQDTLVAHRFTGRFTLGPVRNGAPPTSERHGTLTVAVDNPLKPGGHDTYIVGSMPPTPLGSPSQPRVDNALNRTWFSVWTPTQTAAPEVRVDGQKQFFSANVIHDLRVFDYTLETPSDSTNAFDIDLDGWVDLQRDGDDLIYRLTLWRQAKAIPDHWDLQFEVPPAYRVVSATVTGGGSPFGMGVGGHDGEPISAGVDGRTVRVKGAVTQDAVVEIRMRGTE